MDRDAYGYPTVGLSADEMLARQASSLRARKLVKSWQGLTMLSAADLQSRTAALKPLLRKGLPFEYRPAVWYVLSGATTKRALYPDNFYANICCQPPPELDVHLALQEDIRSGFRQHALFHTPHGLAALQRILFAFFQHSPDVGYFRGLVQMAAFILVVFTLDKEEEAFWVLVAVMEGRMVTSTSEQVALAGKVEQKVLEQLVQKKMPKVFQHVATTEGGFAPLTTWWFSSAFTTVLPAETAVRVWDAMMLEGRKVLLRVALALLKKHETGLLSCSREEQMKRVLDMRCLRTYDAEALLQVAFKGVGSMPNQQINLLRADACKDVALRHEQLHKRLSGMVTRVV